MTDYDNSKSESNETNNPPAQNIDALLRILSRSGVDLDNGEFKNLESTEAEKHFVDAKTPEPLEHKDWQVLNQFADQIIPAVPKLRNKSASEYGFRSFIENSLLNFYAKPVMYSSHTRRKNQYLRNLKNGALFLESLAQRDFSSPYHQLIHDEAKTCTANLELLHPRLFDFLRMRVIESYFCHSRHRGNNFFGQQNDSQNRLHSWKLIGLDEQFFRLSKENF